MQRVPKSGDVAGWTLFRNDLVGVTTERQPRYERAPPFGWPTGAMGFHRAWQSRTSVTP